MSSWRTVRVDRRPIVVGHETIGEVAAVPTGEDHRKVGDRVGAPWHGGHCGMPCLTLYL